MIFLFDMDGTLCDSEEGIKNGIEVALSMMNMKIPPRDDLDDFIGPPLMESFTKELGMNGVEARTTIKWFRDYYMRKGKFENRLYPHMDKVLEAAARKGQVGLATSKPEIIAKEILQHFKIDHYFDIVGGASIDGSRSSKEEVLHYTLEMVTSFDEERIYMIGDRYTDMEGAKKLSLIPIGVLYGYGSKEELLQAGAHKMMDSPLQLKEWIDSL